jgi:hypothetical protein
MKIEPKYKGIYRFNYEAFLLALAMWAVIGLGIYGILKYLF